MTKSSTNDTKFYSNPEFDFQETVLYSVKYILLHVKNHTKLIREIEMFNLKNKQESTILKPPSDDNNDNKIGLISLDWVTKNLYYANEKFLKILNVKDVSKPPKVLCAFEKESILTQVKVFPNQGYVVVLTSRKCI